MDGFEVNKILGAILGTALLVMALRNFSDAIFHKEGLKQNAYPIAGVSPSGGGSAAAAPVALDLPKLLAEAKPEHGQRVSEKCLACHTIAKGAPNSTGPNLWGIVGGPTARLGDAFAYSTAMKKLGGAWTYDRLFAFLENPQGYVAGTKMTFAGLSKATDRADIIAYLRTQSDNPPPLPAPTATPASPAGAPAGGAPANGAVTTPAGNVPAQGMTSPAPNPATPGATTPATPHNTNTNPAGGH